MKPAINIHSGSSIAFAAALTNPTELAKTKRNITKSYPISFRDNPYRPANLSLRVEQYFQEKPAGVPFISAEDAYQYYKVNLNADEKFELMIEIINAKLTQYPILAETITKSGGINWLKTCSHQPTRQENFWTGVGYQSGFITALIIAYRQVAKPKIEALVNTTPKVKSDNFEEKVLSKYATYNAVNKQLYIYFQNKIKAKEWGVFINKELYVGEGYSVEDTDATGWRFVLVIPLVDETAATALAELAHFGLRPSKYNPKEPEMAVS